MRKHIWAESNSALRKVLRSVPMDNSLGEQNVVEYKFGLCYLASNKLHYIYSGMTNNVIATAKVSDKIIMRYRPNSVYASVLSSFYYDDIETIHIPSRNLSRSRGVVISRLREPVQSAILRRREERRAERRQAEVTDEALLENVNMRYDPATSDSPSVEFHFSGGRVGVIRSSWEDTNVMSRFVTSVRISMAHSPDTHRELSNIVTRMLDMTEESGLTFRHALHIYEELGGMRLDPRSLEFHRSDTVEMRPAMFWSSDTDIRSMSDIRQWRVRQNSLYGSPFGIDDNNEEG